VAIAPDWRSVDDSHDEALRIGSMHPAATLGEEGGWVVELIPVDIHWSR
jgi:hypothetical protein